MVQHQLTALSVMALDTLCGCETAPGLALLDSHGAGRITEEFGLGGTFENHLVQGPCCCTSALKVLWLLLPDQQITERFGWEEILKIMWLELSWASSTIAGCSQPCPTCP